MFQKEQQNGKKICALCMEFFCILMAERVASQCDMTPESQDNEARRKCLLCGNSQ
jgi:hypothetical protein